MIRQMALSVWSWFDPIYYSCTRLRYVEPANRNIFRVRPMRYRGPSLQLTDGTWIERGDLLLKIHLHNVVLLRLLLPCQHNLIRSRKLYQLVLQSMPGIAKYISEQEIGGQIKAVIGITQINRGCRQLGFDICEIPNPIHRCIKRLMLLPIYLMSVSQPFRSFHKHRPKMLLMSRQQLFARYGLYGNN